VSGSSGPILPLGPLDGIPLGPLDGPEGAPALDAKLFCCGITGDDCRESAAGAGAFAGGGAIMILGAPFGGMAHFAPSGVWTNLLPGGALGGSLGAPFAIITTFDPSGRTTIFAPGGGCFCSGAFAYITTLLPSGLVTTLAPSGIGRFASGLPGTDLTLAPLGIAPAGGDPGGEPGLGDMANFFAASGLVGLGLAKVGSLAGGGENVFLGAAEADEADGLVPHLFFKSMLPELDVRDIAGGGPSGFGFAIITTCFYLTTKRYFEFLRKTRMKTLMTERYSMEK